MAVRVAIISTAAFILFGVAFFRLWYLQVLDGSRYLAEARSNRVRVERIQAPRGVIRDVNGAPIVANRRSSTLTLDPRAVPEDFRSEIAAWGQAYGRWSQRGIQAVGRQPRDPAALPAWRKRATAKIGPAPAPPRATGDQWALYERLGRVLQRSPERINSTVVSSLVRVPYANIAIKNDVDRAQRSYVGERQDQFRGVSVEQVYVRSYPAKDAAAQILGTVGEISPKQTKEKRFDGVRKGTIIGKSGLEWQYDSDLRGVDGKSRLVVNALGERRGVASDTAPRAGRDLQLTMDLGLQKAGKEALASVGGGLPGAFVALNPRTGAVYAMGSAPTYNPRELQGPFESQQAYRAKFVDAPGEPLVNRAVAGLYPVGSTFKPVTALAALDQGITDPLSIFNDIGCLKIGKRDVDVACNAGDVPHGPVDLVKALEVSSDTYFYNLALRLYDVKGEPLQDWASRLGFGRFTGVDLPEAAKGSIPSKATFKEITEAELACRKRKKVPSCGIGSGDPTFKGGDLVNLSVGQGGLQASPLQLAIAYATIVNGGEVPTPHLGKQIDDSRGFVKPIDPPPSRRVKIDPAARSAIMDGLFQAANGAGGTSTPIWKGGSKPWPTRQYPIFGKTGTAETPKGDQSWYAAYSYRGSPERDPIVVVATVEQGGFGAERAAPITRLILSKYFGLRPDAGDRGAAAD
jgi:penicillin-binding protein 2